MSRSSKPRTRRRPTPRYETPYGRMYCGKAEELLDSYPITRRKGRVQLLFTSPPFALNRKKRYGNREGQEYVEWIASFAPLFREYVAKNGSIVIELGNGWISGKPEMSTLALEALLEFKKRAKLHLCQEFICFNPARLPSPAQWVNVERCRVKDAFTRLWWLSPSTRPKADNRRILTGYSDRMQELLTRGTYNAGRRPSDHNIGQTSFLANHGGAIPPNVLIPDAESLADDIARDLAASNLLVVSNTSSKDAYQDYCRKKKLPKHPARMPTRLIEFFVKFLTEPGDLVLDPFAGSNSTGFVAGDLGRRWLSIEANLDYVRGSKGRFLEDLPPLFRQARV